MTRRRLAPLPTLQAKLAAGFCERMGVAPTEGARMADEVMRDIAHPVAELIGAAWRAVADDVLFDTPLEHVRPGEEESSTEACGLVLDTAAAILTGWAAALEMAHDYARRAGQPASVTLLPIRPATPPTEAAA